jgi:hypothetical protein
MRTVVRLLQPLLDTMQADLSRQHPFAAERVGFLTCGIARAEVDALIVLGHQWHPVADDDYIEDPAVGAAIGPAAFRKILQFAYHNPVSIFHVHRHDHHGAPAFSLVDVRSERQFVPGFFNVQRERPHGAIVLSLDQAAGHIWVSSNTGPRPIEQFQTVGSPLKRWP